MRAVIFSCLLASALLLSVHSPVTTADAQAETYCTVNTTGITKCVSEYVTRATGGQGVCPALDEYIGCLGDLFSCNPYFASSWNNSLSAYRGVWDSFCTRIAAISGFSDVGMVFGDPHYRLTNGSYQTCNDLGSNILAVSKLYIVKVVHSSIGASSAAANGTVVTEVSVEMFHVGAPAGTFTWTLNSSPTPVSKGGITVSANGIDASVIGLNLKVTRQTDHFVLGLVTKKLTGGILLNGCSSPAPLPFQASCLYDLSRVNASWAVSSSNTASNEEASIKATADSQNGAHSSVFAALSALLIVVATLAIMVL